KDGIPAYAGMTDRIPAFAGVTDGFGASLIGGRSGTPAELAGHLVDEGVHTAALGRAGAGAADRVLSLRVRPEDGKLDGRRLAGGRVGLRVGAQRHRAAAAHRLEEHPLALDLNARLRIVEI